jgi:hypothetical protein
MRKRDLRDERGENVLELAGMVALTVGVLGASAYMLFFRPAGGAGFTPQQLAYIAAVQTQQADATIRTVATQRVESPPPQTAPQPPSVIAPPPRAPVEPAPPPVGVPPPTIAPPAAPPPSAPAPTIAPPAPPPPAPTSPPAPPPPSKPPMATCVGFMVGLTSTGLDACQGIISGTTYAAPIRNCIYDIVSGSATSGPGKADCVQASLAAGDANLSDCFLGLSDQSFYGRTSCRMYYGAH